MAGHTTYDLAERLALTSISTPRKTASKTTTWTFGPAIVDEIHVLIPSGHVGLTTIRISYQGVPIIPWNDTANALTGDGEVVKLPVGLNVSKSLTVVTANNDGVAHVHYLRALYHDVPLLTDLGPNPESAMFVFGG